MRIKIAVALLIAHASSPLQAQIRVVNIVPQASSNETNQDSEPNIAVNPFNSNRVAVSAFTPSNGICGQNVAPMFVTTDGGATWALSCVVPSDFAGSGTGDITVAFPGADDTLVYSGILRRPALVVGQTRQNILRGHLLGPNALAVVNDRSQPDQPFVQAGTNTGRHRVYVGTNDFAVTNGRTATVDTSLNAAAAGATFGSIRIERRNTSGQNGPPIRIAYHADGTVYAVYLGQWQRSGAIRTVDVVVVRDDNAGAGGFSNLVDAGDALAGNRIAQNVRLTWNLASTFGQERLGPHLSIAVDPRNSSSVYVVWADTGTTNRPTLHLRHSTDRGVTWDANDLRTIPGAINPSLAINSSGTVGFLYQQLSTGTPARWVTQFERSSNVFSTFSLDTLATVPANAPAVTFTPYIGDYAELMAVGTTFYGTFSANNIPNNANFPEGVTYLRNANFTTNQLLGTDALTPVNVSIDPFFFSAVRRSIFSICQTKPWICRPPIKIYLGGLVIGCDRPGCIVIDPLPRNCLVKYRCPGCPGGGLCPGWYHLTFEGLSDDWDLELYDPVGNPYPHEIVRDGNRTVLSFAPDKKDLIGGEIADYQLTFRLRPRGRPGAEYNLKASIARSEKPFRPNR